MGIWSLFLFYLSTYRGPWIQEGPLESISYPLESPTHPNLQSQVSVSNWALILGRQLIFLSFIPSR
jgi:hypothetical protein